MQALDHDSKPIRSAELYDPKRMKELLDRAETKEVRVFKLSKGMRINIKGCEYKVTAVRPNGKITMRPQHGH